MEVSVDDEALKGFFEALDARVLHEAAAKSKAWFKKDLTVEQVATLFRASLGQDEAGKFARRSCASRSTTWMPAARHASSCTG